MKAYRLLIFTGLALLVAALVIFLWNAAPLISSRLYTRLIPTAPPLAPPLAQRDEPNTPQDDALILLPFLSTGTTPQKPPATVPPTLTAIPSAVTPAIDLLSPTPSETLSPALTPTPYPGAVPFSLRVPILELVAPVVPIGIKMVSVNGTMARMWDVPDSRVVGWHETSTRLGLPGNTVFNGHNTGSGEVFRDLYKIPVGALVIVESLDGEEFAYRVKEKYILPEAGQPLEVRLENAQYVQETPDERLTLVTCHPYGSLVNRLIIIAVPTLPTSHRGEE